MEGLSVNGKDFQKIQFYLFLCLHVANLSEIGNLFGFRKASQTAFLCDMYPTDKLSLHLFTETARRTLKQMGCPSAERNSSSRQNDLKIRANLPDLHSIPPVLSSLPFVWVTHFDRSVCNILSWTDTSILTRDQ